MCAHARACDVKKRKSLNAQAQEALRERQEDLAPPTWQEAIGDGRERG